ncbi:hypothetical protein SF23_15165, partial [Streptomyces sp. MBRL 10]
MKELSFTPCLSGQTPVAMVDQPGPEEVAAIGPAYRLLRAVSPWAIRPWRCGALAALTRSRTAPSMPRTRTLSVPAAGAAVAVWVPRAAASRAVAV